MLLGSKNSEGSIDILLFLMEIAKRTHRYSYDLFKPFESGQLSIKNGYRIWILYQTNIITI